MTVNSVNKSVNFGEQEKRKSGGIGVGVPILGAAVGTSVVALKNGGFRTASLEGLDKDTFSKKMAEVEGLSDEQKGAVKVVQEYLEKQPAEESNKSDEANIPETGKTEAKATEVTTEVPQQKSSVTSKSVDEVFGQETEITPDKYLEKYGYGSTVDTIDVKREGIKKDFVKTQKELEEATRQAKLTNAYVENRYTDAETLKKDILNTENKVKGALENVNRQAAAKKEGITDTNKIAEIEKETQEEITNINKKAAAELNPKYRRLSGLNEVAEKLESQIRIHDEGSKLYSAKFVPDSEKIMQAIKKEGYEAGGEKEKQLLEEETEKRVNAYLDDLEKKNPAKKYTESEYARIKDDYKNKSEVQVEIKKIVDAEINKKATTIRTEEISRQKEEHYTKLGNLAQEKIETKKSLLIKQQAQIAEIDADLALVKQARDGKTNITKGQAEEVLGKTKSNVAEATKNIKGKVAEEAGEVAEGAKGEVAQKAAKALEAIKSKLPKEFTKFNWKGLGYGVAIGLAAGVILKWIFGGKSEE